MKRWSLPRSLLPEAGDEKSLRLVQRIFRQSLFCTIDESNEVEVVFDCNMCFVWDLLIMVSRRPTSRPNFNLDCNHMGQRRYGGN